MRRGPSVVGVMLVLAMALSRPVYGLIADQLALKPGDRPVRVVQTLARLLPGQEVRLELSSRGCFHHEDRVFVFRRNNQQLEVEVGPNTARDDSREVSRTVLLSPADVADIDQELDYHRSPTSDRCTTRDELDLVIREHGREIRREHFVDKSCSDPPPKAKRTTLFALTRPELRQ